MERVRNRKAYVALLLGHLELSVAPTQSRQVPNSGACNGHKGTAPDCGDCQAAASGSERVAHHYCGCRVSLTAAENARQLRSPLEKILNVPLRVRLRCFPRLRPCWSAVLSSRFENITFYPKELHGCT